MENLKDTEKFAVDAIKQYFKKKNKKVLITKGEDPPDIYLELDNQKIAIEITELNENSLNKRETIDMGYIKFIDKLDKKFSKNIIDKKIHINFYHNYTEVKYIQKKFIKFFEDLVKNNKLQISEKISDFIESVYVEIYIYSNRYNPNSDKKITGNTGASHPKSGYNWNDILIDSTIKNIVSESISKKTLKCKNIQKPIWLALLDNYYNKFTYFNDDEHINVYKNIMQDITDFKYFDKILIIFGNKDVLEFNKG